jgi:predicted metal-dependent hydrolase
MLPGSLIEYVVVHELVHLIEPYHTNAFWDRVERIVSDLGDAYGGLRLRKRWLAENGATYDLYELLRSGREATLTIFSSG